MQIAQITSLAPAGTWTARDGKTMHNISLTLSDGQFGTANAQSFPPRYKVGDTVGYDVTGEHQGTPKLKITPQNGQQGGYQQPRQNPPQNPYQAPAHTNTQLAQQNASTGQGQASINGQTVGMALKAAVDLERHNHPNDPVPLAAVFSTASDLIRLAWKLEHGQLAPKTGERQAPPVQQQAPAPQPQPAYANSPAARPQPGPDGQAFNNTETDFDEVPF